MFLRLLIVFIIAAIAVAIFYSLNSKEGNESPLVRGLSKVQSLVKEAEPEKPAETIVYKWQDKNGEWHFSNQPPPEGVASSITTYRSDVNVVPATKPENPPQKEKAKSGDPGDDPADPPLLPIADPAKVKQLVDDAKHVQKLMDEHQQKLDQEDK